MAEHLPVPISNHVTEIVGKSNEYLADAKEAPDLEVQRTYRYKCYNYLLSLGIQIQTYSTVEKSQEDQRWKLLNLVVSNVSHYFELKAEPLVYFGGTYEVTGSNIYEKYHEFSRPSPFYQISADISDPFALISLVAHEVGHCKISEIGGIEVGGDLKRKLDAAALEQCVCDAFAIQMYGPAFVLPFVIYNEGLIGVNWEINFRTRLMMDMLEDFDLQNIAEAIHRFIGKDLCDQTKRTSFVQPKAIINFVQDHVRTNGDLTDKNLLNWAGEIYKIPAGRTDILFNAAWTKFLFDQMSLNEISDIEIGILKRQVDAANSIS